MSGPEIASEACYFCADQLERQNQKAYRRNPLGKGTYDPRKDGFNPTHRR